MGSPFGGEIWFPKLRDASIVRKHLSQYGSGFIGLRIVDGQKFVDPDEISLSLLHRQPQDPESEDTLMIVDPTKIIREDEGTYTYVLGPEYTQERGEIDATWVYTIEGRELKYVDHLTVLEQMPFYETLSENEKNVVEQVSWMFGDMFDSTMGGPNLIENFQTHFTFERIAQLMQRGIQVINSSHQPYTTFGIGMSGSRFPEQWSGLLVTATYLEVIKHFIRSYVEQPEFRNMQVTYTDRRDYVNRWKAVLDEEKEDFKRAVKFFKRTQMGLGRGSLLVSGGIYGGGGNKVFRSGMYSSQVRAYRFMPAAPTIFGAYKNMG